MRKLLSGPDLTAVVIFSAVIFGSSGSGSGDELNYAVRVPDTYRADKPCTLVIAKHGYGDTNSNFETNSGLTRRANDAGYIVAYPQSRSREWNAGGYGFAALTHNADDVSYIMDIIRVRDRFIKDISDRTFERRVHVVLSGGGDSVGIHRDRSRRGNDDDR